MKLRFYAPDFWKDSGVFSRKTLELPRHSIWRLIDFRWPHCLVPADRLAASKPLCRYDSIHAFATNWTILESLQSQPSSELKSNKSVTNDHIPQLNAALLSAVKIP